MCLVRLSLIKTTIQPQIQKYRKICKQFRKTHITEAINVISYYPNIIGYSINFLLHYFSYYLNEKWYMFIWLAFESQWCPR